MGGLLGGLFRGFPLFLSTTVWNNLEAEGRGLKKANAGPSLFFFYCVSVRFHYPVPGNGVGGEKKKVACKIDIRGGAGVGGFSFVSVSLSLLYEVSRVVPFRTECI